MELIFWDVDGTLMHCGASGTKALNLTFFELFGICNAFESAGIGRAMDSAILSVIMERHSIGSENLAEIESRFVLNLDKTLKSAENVRIMPGVMGLLSFFEASGAINSLLTSNLRRGAETKLRSVGLWERCDGTERFTGGGFGDEPGEKWDAAAKALDEIETKLEKKIPNSEVLVIGDGVYDIETAKKCGFRALATATGWTDRKTLSGANPDYLVDSLSEVDPAKL